MESMRKETIVLREFCSVRGIRYKGSKNEGKRSSLTGSFIEKFSNRIELFARIRSVSLRQSLGNLHREMCMD